MARLAITSLTFMLVEVAEPVWKTSSGNWPSSLPSITSWAAWRMALATSAGTEPSSSLTTAASPLIIATAAMNRCGQRQPRDGEIAPRPLRLGAVIRLGGDFDLAQAVFFDSRFRHVDSPEG